MDNVTAMMSLFRLIFFGFCSFFSSANILISYCSTQVHQDYLDGKEVFFTHSALPICFHRRCGRIVKGKHIEKRRNPAHGRRRNYAHSVFHSIFREEEMGVDW